MVHVNTLVSWSNRHHIASAALFRNSNKLQQIKVLASKTFIRPHLRSLSQMLSCTCNSSSNVLTTRSRKSLPSHSSGHAKFLKLILELSLYHLQICVKLSWFSAGQMLPTYSRYAKQFICDSSEWWYIVGVLSIMITCMLVYTNKTNEDGLSYDRGPVLKISLRTTPPRIHGKYGVCPWW